MFWEDDYVKPEILGLLLQGPEEKGVQNSEKSCGKENGDDHRAHAHKGGPYRMAS